MTDPRTQIIEALRSLVKDTLDKHDGFYIQKYAEGKALQIQITKSPSGDGAMAELWWTEDARKMGAPTEGSASGRGKVLSEYEIIQQLRDGTERPKKREQGFVNSDDGRKG